MDPETFLEALGSDYEELQAVVDELNGERRKSSQTLIAKNETSDRYDHLFAPIANALQVFYVLAGMDELARRIRPSTRRPGRRQEVADETLSSDDEPGDAEEATAAGAESETGAAIAA